MLSPLVLVTTSPGASVSFPNLEVVFLMGWFVAGVYALYLGLSYLPVLLAWSRWGQRLEPTIRVATMGIRQGPPDESGRRVSV